MSKRSQFIDIEASTDSSSYTSSIDETFVIPKKNYKSFEEFAQKYADNEAVDIESSDKDFVDTKKVTSQVKLMPTNRSPSLWIVRCKRGKEVECVFKILKNVSSSKIECLRSSASEPPNEKEGKQQEKKEQEEWKGNEEEEEWKGNEGDNNNDNNDNNNDNNDNFNNNNSNNPNNNYTTTNPNPNNISNPNPNNNPNPNYTTTNPNNYELEDLFNDDRFEHQTNNLNPNPNIKTPLPEGILSIIHKPDLLGYIYIESYSRQAVLDITKEIPLIYSQKTSAVPLNEMPDCLQLKTFEITSKYAKIKKGKYKNEICQIIRKVTNEIVTVAIVPKINNTYVKFNPITENATKFRKFGEVLYLKNKNVYCDGLLRKDLPVSFLNFCEIDFASIKLFSECNFEQNDLVKILKGDFKGMLGKILQIRNDTAEIEIIHNTSESSVKDDLNDYNDKSNNNDLNSYNDDNDYNYNDISVKGNNLNEITIKGNNNISKKKKNKHNFNEDSSVSENESDFISYKKKRNNENKKIKKKRNTLEDSDEDNTIDDSQNVRYSTHYNDNSQNVRNSNHYNDDSFNINSQNNISFKSNALSLKSLNTETFRIPLTHLQKHYQTGTEISYKQRNAQIVAVINNEATIIYTDNFYETETVNLNEIQPKIKNKYEIIKNHNFNKKFTDNMFNKYVQIQRGKFKGCRGTIKNVYKNHYRIALDTMEQATVEKEGVVVYDRESVPTIVDSASCGDYFADGSGKTPFYDAKGGKTPFYDINKAGKTPFYDVKGGKTPHYGGKTPHYGSKTPHFGGKTPHYDTNRAGKTPHYGGKTPFYGGKTPHYNIIPSFDQTPTFNNESFTPTTLQGNTPLFPGKTPNYPNITPTLSLIGNKTPNYYKSDLFGNKTPKYQKLAMKQVPTFDQQQSLIKINKKLLIYKQAVVKIDNVEKNLFDHFDDNYELIRPEVYDKVVVVSGSEVGKIGLVTKLVNESVQLLLDDNRQVSVHITEVTKKQND